MKEWHVYYMDLKTGACSPIDTITVLDNYTPDQYRKDCEANDCDICEGGFILFEDDNVVWYEGNESPEYI